MDRAKFFFTDVPKAMLLFTFGVEVYTWERILYDISTRGTYIRAAHPRTKTFAYVKIEEVYDIPYRKHVTGTITPDSTGDYHVIQIYNGNVFYKRNDGAYYIWWDGVDSWIISTALGVTGAIYHKRSWAGAVGQYSPIGGATGWAFVEWGWP